MESALYRDQVHTKKNIYELRSNLPSPTGPPFLFPLWNPWKWSWALKGENTHTHNENYTLIPKSILNQWISSLIKFKIYYKKKKLYFKNKLYHILIREKSRHPLKITMQKCQGTSIYNYPLAYHAGNQLVI